MKSIIVLLTWTIALYSCQPSTPAKETASTEASPESGYDVELAAELGADDYGMRSYVMAFLKRGPNRSADSLTAANLQRAHLDNIKRLAKEGKLILAGPFMDSGDVRGIYVFAVATIEEAEALTATDPAIQAGSLVMELHPWYGSAALMKLEDYYPRITKKEI